MSNFIANNPSIAFLVDIHSYSQVIGWPYSYEDRETEDEYTFSLMGSNMHDIIEAVHASSDWGWGGWGPIKHTNPYACAGTITDWSYFERGIFSFDFEIRPHVSDYSECNCSYDQEPTYDPAWPDKFRPSPTYIIPSGQEVWESVKYVMERARTMNVLRNQWRSSGNYYGSAIIAGAGVTVSGNVMFEASDYIHLKQGFHALSGSTFDAHIQIIE